VQKEVEAVAGNLLQIDCVGDIATEEVEPGVTPQITFGVDHTNAQMMASAVANTHAIQTRQTQLVHGTLILAVLTNV